MILSPYQNISVGANRIGYTHLYFRFRGTDSVQNLRDRGETVSSLTSALIRRTPPGRITAVRGIPSGETGLFVKSGDTGFEVIYTSELTPEQLAAASAARNVRDVSIADQWDGAVQYAKDTLKTAGAVYQSSLAAASKVALHGIWIFIQEFWWLVLLLVLALAAFLYWRIA